MRPSRSSFPTQVPEMPTPRGGETPSPRAARRREPRPVDAQQVVGDAGPTDNGTTALPAAPTTANTPERADGWEHANVPSFPWSAGASDADVGITDERDLQRASLEQVRGAVGDTSYGDTMRDHGVVPDAPPRSRDDERIVEEIHRRLVAHPWLDSSDVEVDVAEGVVTLGGRVPTRTMRRELEDTCHAVHGVHDVLVRVRVSPTRS
jgi:hypothetical protein